MFRLFHTFVLVVTLVACAPRGDLALDQTAAAVGTVHPILFGTTRAQDPETGQLTGTRRSLLRFGTIDVSVPPDRKPGEINWPRQGGAPDPATDFVTTDLRLYPNASGFRASLSQALAARAPADREVALYVHGYNNTFAESMYRIAQIDHDIGAPAISVAYAWPSAGRSLRYFFDRDSVLFARDGLEDLIEAIAAAGADRIILIGHSMGANLTMEALRDISISGRKDLMAKIGGVILISPDIDTQVFRRQVDRIGALPQPFLIFTSSKDKPLALSARFAGRGERLGNLVAVEKVADLDVTLLDTSAFSSGRGHFVAGDSPAVLGLLGQMGSVVGAFGSTQSKGTPFFYEVVVNLEKAKRIVLTDRGSQLDATRN